MTVRQLVLARRRRPGGEVARSRRGTTDARPWDMTAFEMLAIAVGLALALAIVVAAQRVLAERNRRRRW